MKKRFPKFLSAVLAAVLLLSMVPAMAADAYGQQLQERSVQLNEGTQLQIENYLSGSGGLRQEIYVTYSPNENVTPVVTYGGSVTVTVRSDTAHVTLEVADTGIGIAPEHHSRVFERFYRVDKSHSKEIGGTGLGLSIVKHGAAFHHAQVELESALDKGTTVRIIFPQFASS